MNIPFLVPSLLLGVLVAAGFVLAAPMNRHVEAPPAFTPEEVDAAKESIALSLLGQLQMSVSDLMWLKSMEYLHLGVTQRQLTQREEEAGAKRWGTVDTAAGLDHKEGRNMVLDPEEDWRGVLGTLDRQVRPYTTQHLHDDPVELIPWYQLAVRMNPHLERLYTLGAFYMADFAQEPGEAFELLSAGAEANPFSFEIHFAFGRLLFDYRSRIAELEHHHDDDHHHHDDHHHDDHHHDDHHHDDHHHHGELPESTEAALQMAVEHLRIAIESAERQKARLREQGKSFDEFSDQSYRESYLFLARALTELEQYEEAIAVCDAGFQSTMHNHLRIQKRIIERAMRGEDEVSAEDAAALGT